MNNYESLSKYRPFIVVFCPVIISFAVLMLPFTVEPIVSGIKTNAWPTTTGKITISEMSGPHLTKHGPEYITTVQYDYQIGNAVYTNNKVSYKYLYAKNLDEAQSLLKKYPVYRHVLVRYNPDDISDTVLEAGVSFKTFTGLGVCLIGIIVGAIILTKSLNEKNKERKAMETVVRENSQFE